MWERDKLFFCNPERLRQLRNDMAKTREEGVDELYNYITLPLIILCASSVLFNALLVLMTKQRKSISGKPVPILSFNLGLTDLGASILNGWSIFVSIYIGRVLKYNEMCARPPLSDRFNFWCAVSSPCFSIAVEAIRITALAASALHLLALACVHYLGVRAPMLLQRANLYTSKVNLISGLCWFAPLIIMFTYFSTFPCQGFSKPLSSTDRSMMFGNLTLATNSSAQDTEFKYCDHLFMLGRTSRTLVLMLFGIPLALMVFIYTHIFFIIHRHPKGHLTLKPQAHYHAHQLQAQSVVTAVGCATALNQPELMASQIKTVRCAFCSTADGIRDREEPEEVELEEEEEEEETEEGHVEDDDDPLGERQARQELLGKSELGTTAGFDGSANCHELELRDGLEKRRAARNLPAADSGTLPNRSAETQADSNSLLVKLLADRQRPTSNADDLFSSSTGSMSSSSSQLTVRVSVRRRESLTGQEEAANQHVAISCTSQSGRHKTGLGLLLSLFNSLLPMRRPNSTLVRRCSDQSPEARALNLSPKGGVKATVISEPSKSCTDQQSVRLTSSLKGSTQRVRTPLRTQFSVAAASGADRAPGLAERPMQVGAECTCGGQRFTSRLSRANTIGTDVPRHKPTRLQMTSSADRDLAGRLNVDQEASGDSRSNERPSDLKMMDCTSQVAATSRAAPRHHRLRRKYQHARASSSSGTTRQTIMTTLAILATYFGCYGPPVILGMVQCVDGCGDWALQKWPESTRVYINSFFMLLLIGKTFLDPCIYNRMREVKVTWNRYLNKKRSRSSLANSLQTSQRANNSAATMINNVALAAAATTTTTTTTTTTAKEISAQINISRI